MHRPIKLEPGDVLVIPEGGWHWVADSLDSGRIPAAEVAQASLEGHPMFQDGPVATRLLCGRFRFDRELTHPLMSALPPLIHLPQADSPGLAWLQETGDWMYKELTNASPGSEILVDRLCEIYFIQALRSLQALDVLPTGFVAALNDRRINKSLQLVHSRPQESWTLERVAGEIGMSRAVFAERFHRLIGLPFNAYLTAWRMQKAINLLKRVDVSASRVADEVGYSSDISFSRAFRRYFGKTPGEYRKELAVNQAA